MQRATGLILATILSGAALATSPPTTVNYQGVLRDTVGDPIDRDVDMTFRLFDAEVAGNEILVDTHVLAGTGQVTVTGGLFNVAVGSGAVSDGSGPGFYVSPAEVFPFWYAVVAPMIRSSIPSPLMSPALETE